jgi:hypothetical protein
MRKGVYYVTTLLGMILTVTCVLFIFWLLRPYSYIVADQPETLRSKYEPGGPVFIIYDKFCMNRSMDIRVQRSATNMTTGRKVYLLPYEFPKEHNPVQCIDNLIVEVPLPDEMNPGTYTLTTTISYKPNPIRTETATFTTNPFKVALKEGP